MDNQEIIRYGRQAVAVEAAALNELEKRLDERFARTVALISACRGKVVLTGIGKSGIICRKIAATLASTGTPAIFLHPTEGLHGDLGILSRDDLVIAISYSGVTEELIKIVPSLKRQGLPLLAFTANAESELARASDLVLDISTKKEACPLGLAPTASTTVTLALGDALAVALLAARGFKPEDFALRHPGGTLGRRLLLKVSDIMHSLEETPLVDHKVSLQEALLEMTGKGFGVTGIIDTRKLRLVGVITDGDLRRFLTRYPDPLNLPVSSLMTPDPKTIGPDELAATALKRMQDAKITSLFILSPETRHPLGIIHLHDLLRAGVV